MDDQAKKLYLFNKLTLRLWSLKMESAKMDIISLYFKLLKLELLN